MESLKKKKKEGVSAKIEDIRRRELWGFIFLQNISRSLFEGTKMLYWIRVIGKFRRVYMNSSNLL